MTIQKCFTERLSFQWASYMTQWATSNRLLSSQNFQGRIVCSSTWHVRTSRFLLQKWKMGRPRSSSPTWGSGYVLCKRLNSPPKPPALAVSPPQRLLPWQFLLPSSEAHYSVALLILIHSMSGNSDRKPGVKKQGSYGNDWKCRFLSSQTQNHLEILEQKCSGYSENLFQTSYSKSHNFYMLQSAIILAAPSPLSVRMTISNGIPAFKEFWV